MIYTFCMIFYIAMMMSKNPFKISVAMLLISSFLFWEMHTHTGETMLPMMMFLLFSGGIILMFMFMASLTPNMPMKKSNYFMLIFILLSSMSMNLSKLVNDESTMKMSFMNMETSLMIVVMVLAYFFSFLMIICKSSGTMRSFNCC